jgi:hypothetical protein
MSHRNTAIRRAIPRSLWSLFDSHWRMKGRKKPSTTAWKGSFLPLLHQSHRILSGGSQTEELQPILTLLSERMWDTILCLSSAPPARSIMMKGIFKFVMLCLSISCTCLMTSRHMSAATWTLSTRRYSLKGAYRLDLTDFNLLVVVIRGRHLTEYVIGFHVWQQDLNTFRSSLPTPCASRIGTDGTFIHG